MSRSLKSLLSGGFVLELAGRPGSGRREAARRLLSALGGTALYLDYSGTYWRSRGGWGGVSFESPGDPLELLSAFSTAGEGVVVLDSIPRVFHAFDLEYRARWGLVASLLGLAVDRASRGLGSIFINYWSGGRSFGEQVFSAYYTHRALVARQDGRLALDFYCPSRVVLEV
ncbi:hypothetical protein IG193_03820 [Infirmifilum lucidum]|uniref:Uncharacterized protein n=1 Tax=Infirmifilum lucidum TaxID=2776706 RepID=A0A7L9FL57_9CREN|nr:hypothetical protein [Infirmifilum lucidum]QOJ79596.1 hypothetical protein IG193_03820 [Infirmifilum lucidum]